MDIPKIEMPVGERAGVLIVDDTPAKLVALGAIVSGMELEIVTATSGEQALRQLLKRDFAVILLDVNMPTMDGFETATLIRSRPRSEHTPIIFVTAEANSEAERISGYTLGAVDFIYSPIIPEILRAKVQVFVNLFYLQRQVLLHTEELKARQQELANSNQVLNGLYRIAEGLNRAVSEREVAEAALEQALELPGIQAGWISLREGESGFRLAATRNLPPALEVPGALEGDCLCRRQLLAGELDAVNILECERLGKTKGDTRGLRYHASIPLWLVDQMVGVMNLVGPQEGVFKEEELKVLHGVGQQVVVALERARLHEHLEQLVEQRTAALTEEITERKKAEELLRNSEVILFAIINTALDAVVQIDSASIITRWNNQAEEIFGWTREEAIGRMLHETIIPPQYREAHIRGMKHFLATGEGPVLNKRIEIMALHRDGHEFPIELSITSLEIADKPEFNAFIRDITESKRVQGEVQRVGDLLRGSNANLNQEMAERLSLEIELIRVSEEQRRVIGCELHDGLGQHLISLSLLCASLQQQLTNRAQPEANAARRIGELIDEATTMTRSVARGLYPADLEYGGLIAALEQLTDHARSLHKMDYVLSVAPGVQVHDQLVAINLYRIAQEAITNALKYSQAGLMRIDLARVDGKVRLTLSDDGIGIDPSRLGPAKGLGMHSMHYRASLLGGSMEIESNAQQGTTITVTYPDLEGQSEQRNRA